MSFVKTEYKYSELTGTIIGSAIEVHSELGIGFSEKIYQKCLAMELKKAKVRIECERTLPVYFKGVLVGNRRLDMLVNQKVIVELKSRPYLHDSDFIQLRNYLNITGIEIGLLLNFGSASLQYRRCIQSLDQ